MLFFAFSTIIGWYFFGEQNVKALFGHKAVKVYAAIVVICIVIGSALHVDLVWNLSDLFNGLMVFPNLIALLALSGLVAKGGPRQGHYEVSYDLSRNYTVCAGIGSIQYYLIENAPQFCGAFFADTEKNTGFRVLSTV